MVNRAGELRYFINGVDQGVAWTGVPTEKVMWGFADIYGLARKIKSEFLLGEFTSYYYRLSVNSLFFSRRGNEL